jgi:16S rRNA (cytidine1402-2'-O)-methyltransferase
MKRARGQESEKVRRPEPSAPRAKRQSSVETPQNDLVERLAPGLYVVATPIGNLSDLSPRAAQVLAQADLIAAEDTRVTGKLLNLIGLKRPMISYTEHNDQRRSPEILASLAQGQAVALVSDAGTPLISDPGQRLVEMVAGAGHRIFPVPGPSAAIAALSVAGISTERFLFVGFLPAKASARHAALVELREIKASLILYEAPHRLVDCLADCHAIFGARQAVVARELTKMFEEIRRGTLPELAARAAAEAAPKGEIVIVIAPPDALRADQADDAVDVDELLRQALVHHSLKDAVAAVADAHGLNRRQVYARALALKPS